MLNFEVRIQRNPPVKPDLQAIAGAMAGVLAAEFGPEFELWEIEANLQNGRFDLRKSTRRMRSVAALNPAAREWLQAGDVVIVGFYQRDRNRPYIKADSPVGRAVPFKPGLIVLGLWPMPEGQPRLSLGPIGQSKWGLGSTLSEIASLQRAESGALDYSQVLQSLDRVGLVALSNPNNQIILATMAVRYVNAGDSPSTHIIVTEFQAGSQSSIVLPLRVQSVGAGLFPGILPQRQAGYFFVSETDAIYYTIAVEGSLVTFRRDNPAALGITNLPTVRHSGSALRDGAVSVAGDWAADCRYLGYDSLADFPRAQADRAKARFFSRNELQWTAFDVDLPSLVPTTHGPLTRIFPVGIASANGLNGTAIETCWLGNGSQTQFELPCDNPTVNTVHVWDSPGGSYIPGYTLSGAVLELDAPPSPGHKIHVQWIFDPTQYDVLAEEAAFQANLDCARWPFLAFDNVREFWWTLSSETEGGRFFQILATDPRNGDTTIVFTDSPTDWNGEETAPAVIAAALADLASGAATSRQPGQTESVWYQLNVGELHEVYASCAPPGSSPDTVSTWTGLIRGYFLDGFSVGASNNSNQALPLLTQPQGDDWHYDPSVWGDHWSRSQDSAAAVTWSRQHATGVFDSAGNHYAVWSRVHRLASDIYPDITGSRTLIEERGDPFVAVLVPAVSGLPEEALTVLITPEEEPPANAVCVDPPQYPIKVFADHVIARPVLQEFWRTWLVVHDKNKRLKYKTEITDLGDWDEYRQCPLHAAVWAWQAVAGYLVVVRDRHWQRSGDSIEGWAVEPVIEVREANTGRLRGRRSLHPAADPGRQFVPDTRRRPVLRVESGQAIVFTTWLDSSNPSDSACGHAIAICAIPDLATNEHFEVGLKPAAYPSGSEARNSVLHDGKLYWLDANSRLVWR